MSEIQRLTTSKNRVSDLGVQFRFQPVRRPLQERVKEFDCIVEANVWRSDDRIVQDERMMRNVMILRALRDPVFYWGQKHVINSLVHKHRQIRLYKTFDSSRAREACDKINEYIALLIAPTQHVWIKHHNLAMRMMVEASDFLVVNHVMTI